MFVTAISRKPRLILNLIETAKEKRKGYTEIGVCAEIGAQVGVKSAIDLYLLVRWRKIHRETFTLRQIIFVRRTYLRRGNATKGKILQQSVKY